MTITPADLITIEARLARNRGDVRSEGDSEMSAQRMRGAVDRERDLHEEISEHCRKMGWVCNHGIWGRKSHRPPGEVDFQIFADGGRVFLIECKSKTGKMSEEQQATFAWLKKLGFDPKLVVNMREFLDVVTK